MNKKLQEIIQNLIIALTVSFAALSLGAAFGVLSGRSNGALIGMLSAGIIALVTSLFGGTRLQCSGPTGPMTAMITPVIQAASVGIISAWGYDNITITNPDHFVNIVILLSSLLIIICGVLKLGSFIKLVPQPVISGFMDGIAIIIVVSQIEKLFGLGKIKAFEGVVYINILVAFLTLILIFIIPKLLNIISNQLPKFLPGTLASIIFMTLISNLFPLNIENINISTNLNNLNDLKSILLDQFPADWSYVCCE